MRKLYIPQFTRGVLVAALLLGIIGLTTSAVSVRMNYRQLWTQTALGTALTGAVTDETELSGTGEGSRSLSPHRFNKSGAVTYYRGSALFSCDDGGGETLQFKATLDGAAGQDIFDTGALLVDVAAVTDSPFNWEIALYTTTTGATGVVRADWEYSYTIGAGTPVHKEGSFVSSAIDLATDAVPVGMTGTWAGTNLGAGDTVRTYTGGIGNINYD